MDITTANRLVQYRKQRGYSQEELAAELGLSRQAVSKWERAEASPDTDNLIALARLYGVSLDELLLSEAPPPVPQRSDSGGTSAPQRPDSAVTAPAQAQAQAPNLDLTEIIETGVMNEIAGDLHETFAPPPLPAPAPQRPDSAVTAPPHPAEGRPPLSAGARRLLGLFGIGAFIIFFFVYGLLSLIFPNLMGAYPLLCTALYLALGFGCNLWHPGWLIYLTIPIYYTMFG